MKYKDELKVRFYNEIEFPDEYTGTGRSKATIRVQTVDNGCVARIKIKQHKEGVGYIARGWVTGKNEAFADLDESELDDLIGMLETCKSKLKEGN